MAILAPSRLSADFSKRADDVARAEKGGAGFLHVDVMDGHFVPNISFGAAVMKSLLGKTGLPFDVHLMIERPDDYLEDFITEKTEYITVHQEACTHLHRTVQHIKSAGAKAGVSINPATPLSAIEEILCDVHMVLIMSVNPGFGGQKLIPSALDKVKRLAKLRDELGYDFKIELDGGVTIDNVMEVVDAGVDIVVAGSAVFGSDDIEKTTKIIVESI